MPRLRYRGLHGLGRLDTDGLLELGHDLALRRLLTEEEAALSDLKHIITRSVGFEREVQADVLTVNVSPGDAFLVCSDGLCNYIDLEEFAHLARQHFYADLPKVCMDIALERGGEDNITVVVIAASNGPDRRTGPRPQRKTIADTLPPLDG